MTRPLQKKKNRSSIPRVRQRSKRKYPNIKANPIIASNWNSKETLRQNYRRLGLTSRLNASTGGVDRRISTVTSISNVPSISHPDAPYASEHGKDAKVKDSPFAILPSTSSSLQRHSHQTSSNSNGGGGLSTVRVQRDPTTGAITKVLHPEPSVPASAHKPLNDPLNEIPSPPLLPTNTPVPEDGSGSGAKDSIVPRLELFVREAEEQARKKEPRRQSEREREWIAKLVERWGDDLTAMRDDRRLNPRQQGEAELRKKVLTWRKERERATAE